MIFKCFDCVTDGEPPELIEGLTDLISTSPEKVTLQCTLKPGDPKAVLRWFKDDKELRSSKRIEMTLKGQRAMCVIDKVEFGDSGWYRLEAENKLGRVQTQCTLTVNCKYTFIYRLNKSNTVALMKSVPIVTISLDIPFLISKPMASFGCSP